MNCDQARLLIGPYVDGELSSTESVELERHLGSCADCTAELEATEALRTGVRNLIQPTASEELKRSIDRSLPTTPKKPLRRLPYWQLGLAYAAILVVGLLIGRSWRSSDVPRQALVAELVQDHVRSLMPGHLMDVISTDRHTVKPWFIGKTTISPTPYDLKSDGFPLLGGRLDLVANRPVPVLIYGRRKHLINLFVLPPEVGSGEWKEDQRGFHLVAWSEGGLEYVTVSDVDPADLLQFENDYLAPH